MVNYYRLLAFSPTPKLPLETLPPRRKQLLQVPMHANTYTSTRVHMCVHTYTHTLLVTSE